MRSCDISRAWLALVSFLLALTAVLSLASCTFEQPFTSCTTDAECALDQRCNMEAGVCVAGADVIVLPDGVDTTGEVDTGPANCGTQWTLLECQGTLNSACCQPGTGARNDCSAGGDGCECATVGFDNQNCGGCGIVCEPGSTCQSGACTCPPGLSDCGLGCVDILSAPEACGGCGTSCPSGQGCIDGSCLCGDPGSAIFCSGSENCCGLETGGVGCVELLNSSNHCGACGVTCGDGEVCESGQCKCGDTLADGAVCTGGDVCCQGSCVPPQDGLCYCAGGGDPLGSGGPCPAGNLCCSDACVDSDTDDNDCGQCGVACDRLAAAAFTCVDGACRCSGATPHECNGDCTNFQDDEANCGTCGNACAGGETCCGGLCKNLSDDEENCGTCGSVCGSGETCCTGSCKSLSVDAVNCGTCGHSCDSDPGVGSGSTCASGSCNYKCQNLRDDCNNSDGDGCETSLNTLTDCGQCSVICDLAGASESCASGTCQVSACAGSLENCDGNSNNGCEIDLADDPSNCGACGRVCADDAHAASGSCVNRDCDHVCDTGWDDCDGNDDNGCERSLRTTTNCGTCNVPCSLDHASESCTTGACVITACNATWDDCDTTASNGCETSLKTLTDCGSCNNPCTIAHGTPDCATGACLIATCDTGWGNCDNDPANGCETNLALNTSCGTCTNNCTNDSNITASTCVSGSCQYTCDATHMDCSGSNDGCETNITTNTNCGSCTNNCTNDSNITASTCVSGSCQYTCDSTHMDCSGSNDGCETNITTNTNCGSCTNNCTNDPNITASTCVSGSCQYTCDSTHSDCGGSNDGCETLTTTNTNCGACGNNCTNDPNITASSCVSGSCSYTCDSTHLDCSGTNDGCESSKSSNTTCGTCANDCTNDPNITASSCSAGSCSYTCDSTHEDCSGTNDGCESTASSSVCGPTCDDCTGITGQTCVSDACACPSGQEVCGSACVNKLTDESNCGTCGNACASGNGFCDNGTCRCNSGGDTCDLTKTDVTGVSCAGTNCTYTCATNTGDCDSSHSNGCETPLTTSTDCGSCGTACGGDCSTGTCL